MLRYPLPCCAALAMTAARGQPAGVGDFSGLYRPAGLAVQPCPGTKPYDPARQPGKETLLCSHLDAQELAAAQAEFGDRILLLRGNAD